MDFKVNVGSWVRKNALIYPKKVAVKWGSRAFTYRQLEERVNRLANGLKAKGLKKGDRVALYLANCPEYVEAVFACSAAGLLAVPLNWRLGMPELKFILNDCTPKALIAHTSFGAKADELAQSCRSIGTRLDIHNDGAKGSYEAFLEAASTEDAVDPAVGGSDAHLIMYTAGTTGDPKGVVLTHENCFWQSVNGWALGVDPRTVALVLLPLFHVGGLNGSVTPMIHVGATVLLPPKYDTAETLKTIQEEKVTGMVAVPTVYQMMYEHPDFAKTDLSSVSAFISGGAPLPESLIRKYHERNLEFRQGYGLTETSPGATGMGPGECLNKAGTAGRPCLYVDIKIVDGDGKQCPTGESGEVLIRGPNLMAGYWNRPEETARTIKDGWLHSGDIGFLDEDGYLTLVDRKKDMIISGGENVYPAEVEKALAAHPGVADVAVIGRPDDTWGEVPVAFVVPRPGTTLTAADMIKFCADTLARYKTPKDWHFRAALPRNAAGKLIKAELKAELKKLMSGAA